MASFLSIRPLRLRWSPALGRVVPLWLAAVVLMSWPASGRAQLPGTLDPTFAPTVRTDGTVAAIAKQPDGKLLVGGGFYRVGPVVSPAIARLDADGSGVAGEFALTRRGGDLTQELTVSYSVAGTGANGVDYVMLKGTRKFKPGKTTVNIHVTPEGYLNGAVKRTVKLTLESGSGYTVGTTSGVKVKIFAAGP